MQAEYKRRHNEIWPEMVELLKSAGIKNDTIWPDGEVLFGYANIAILRDSVYVDDKYDEEYKHGKNSVAQKKMKS